MMIEVDNNSETHNAYGLFDLPSVARQIRDEVGPLPRSYLSGKTAMRDSVMEQFEVSAATAERVVDQLERRGLVEFIHDRRNAPIHRRPSWHFKL